MKIFTLLGFLSIGVGALGAVLPLLPTTPFMILAAMCFSKSSERWHNWLLNNKIFGSCIQKWESQRCVNCKTKIISLLSMAVMGGASVGFASHGVYFKVIAGLLMCVGAYSVIRLTSCESVAVQASDKAVTQG
ncbi:Inner membrane protein YbaN [Zhongshania aliphaticivorans]|uniref:Inner membrane protein n=1 Tax=Zhongshania aliphaticivorans TaxID=1470434 RepID=A0A5S9P5T7_9GAMM|nr:YbaN family protein [Zhongshania aliphaticivorans]CAA0091199.1 Inner membrane protein YbaN [Zhongshania aliphaticivorans]CAA0098660.1 Inner membrane protein YbaN [Zhongshania aliphaticivorans]